MSPITNDNSFKIRPAGRLLLSIGRDLIRNVHSALIELVKNAYDADARMVSISLSADRNKQTISIVVADDGHGMTRDVVVNKWLVPATQDKVTRKKSPNGRVLQGRKGVGRFAASLLGSDLLLETTTAHRKTSLMLFWEDFERAQFLDDVNIIVETEVTKMNNGTKLTMSGGREHLEQWTPDQLEHLRYELKKLVSPISTGSSGATLATGFDIMLEICGFGENDCKLETLPPFPLYDLYDYRISGTISAHGEAHLEYASQKAKNIQTEQIVWDPKTGFGPTKCGNLSFDIRVYDREPTAIDALIQRGLRDESGDYMGKLEARRLLDSANGIGVYRNGFRISPLGDAEYDWLRLNEERIQNPTMRIGSNQVIGCVQIESEELSHLEEKSARDGLKENEAYQSLVSITKKVINALEERRYRYRKGTKSSRASDSTPSLLNRALSLDDVVDSIRKKLPPGETMSPVVQQAVEDAVSEKIAISEEAIKKIDERYALYQGQATLGRIINVVLHEGRRPLSTLKNQIPNVRKFHEKYMAGKDEQWFVKMDSSLVSIQDSGNSFVALFERIDPFAAKRRSPKRTVVVADWIRKAQRFFAASLEEQSIQFSIRGDVAVTFDCWGQDLVTIFANLIDNSVFWIVDKDSRPRKIDVKIVARNGRFSHIDYHDTGPGISKDNILSEVIFDPGFSTKSNGMGLGLAIAGEAAIRNQLELRAIESDSGAHFRLSTKEQEL